MIVAKTYFDKGKNMGFIPDHTERKPVLYEVNSLPRPTIIDFHNISKVELYSEYCRIIDLKGNKIQLSHEWAKRDPVFCMVLNKKDNTVSSTEFDQLLLTVQANYIPIFYGDTDYNYLLAVQNNFNCV